MHMSKPFRILSLSGGGVRGIIQANFLKHIADKLESPLYKNFDMICCTSTGAIVGTAIAMEKMDMKLLVNLYKDKGGIIFKKKLFGIGGMWPGPLYDQEPLRKELKDIFGSRQLKDLKTKVLITAASIDPFKHRVFTNFQDDIDISVVDAVLASSAAPTYFAPVNPDGDDRSYVDGGLWANNPSIVGIFYANKYLDIPINDIRLISIGTGDFSSGRTPNDFFQLRQFSVGAVKTTLEIMFATQSTFADKYAEEIIGDENFLRIKVQLDKPIALDDTKSIERLISKSADAASENESKIKKMLDNSNIKEKHSIIHNEEVYAKIYNLHEGYDRIIKFTEDRIRETSKLLRIYIHNYEMISNSEVEKEYIGRIISLVCRNIILDKNRKTNRSELVTLYVFYTRASNPQFIFSILDARNNFMDFAAEIYKKTYKELLPKEDEITNEEALKTIKSHIKAIHEAEDKASSVVFVDQEDAHLFIRLKDNKILETSYEGTFMPQIIESGLDNYLEATHVDHVENFVKNQLISIIKDKNNKYFLASRLYDEKVLSYFKNCNKFKILALNAYCIFNQPFNVNGKETSIANILDDRINGGQTIDVETYTPSMENKELHKWIFENSYSSDKCKDHYRIIKQYLKHHNDFESLKSCKHMPLCRLILLGKDVILASSYEDFRSQKEKSDLGEIHHFSYSDNEFNFPVYLIEKRNNPNIFETLNYYFESMTIDATEED